MATSVQRQRRLYVALLVAYAAYVLAMFACGNADSGPPRWLDDLEIDAGGRFWTLGNVLLLTVPPYVVLQLARRRLLKRDELDVATGWLSGRRPVGDWLWAGSLGLFALAVGGTLLYRGLHGEVHVLRAADVELVGTGDLDVGARVEVHGFPAKKAIRVERLGGATYYVPIVGTKPPPTIKKAEGEDAPPPVPAPPAAPPAVLVESQDAAGDFEVDPKSGEVTARGVVVATPLAARVAGAQIGLAEDHPVLFVHANASLTRDFVAGGLLLLVGLGAAAAQLKKKKMSTEFDRVIARNEGAW